MKFKKFVLLPLFISFLTGCNFSNGTSYIKLGETISSGSFSQTLVELNYYRVASSDPNEVGFEVIFDLTYSGNKVVPLSPSFKAVFDKDESLGYYVPSFSGNMPSSMAPNAKEQIKLSFRCFKDWETVKVSYSYTKDTSSSFSLKSSDFAYSTNNLLPYLKAGESISTSDGIASVQINDIKRTSIGSAYAGDNDNVAMIFTVSNNTYQNLSFSRFNISFDNGLSIGYLSISSDTQPMSINANSFTKFGLIYIIATKDWKNCIVETKFNQNTILRFNLSHSDYNY